MPNKSRSLMLIAGTLLIAILLLSISNLQTSLNSQSSQGLVPTQISLIVAATPLTQSITSTNEPTHELANASTPTGGVQQNMPTVSINDSSASTSTPNISDELLKPNPTTAYTLVQSQPIQVPPPQNPVPNQVIISFKPDAKPEEIAAYITSIGGTVNQKIGALNTIVVNLPTGSTQSLPISSIMTANEPDYFVSAQVDTSPVPNDPLYSQQWALPVIGAPDAWASISADAPKITVAVIDSGICADHSDLQGRILSGWDFVENDAVPQDDFGHGCGVAGIIAANANDDIGIAGVAPNAMIMPLRVLNAQGVGTYSDVATAIIYAADNGAQIINLSLGGSNPSAMLENAINYVVAKGVIVVAAAGNTGGRVLYPAAYEPVIAVGSIDQNLQRSSFSSYGPEIDLLAPGRDILTTKRDGTYVTMSGTSFAAPNAAGVLSVELARGNALSTIGEIVAFSTELNSQLQTATSLANTSSPTLAKTLEPIISPTDISTLPRETIETGQFLWSPTANVIAFWQVNTLPGSPGFLNFDLILFNVDSGERFVLAEGGETGPMQFSTDGSILWFWYNSTPFVANPSDGSISPITFREIPIEGNFNFKPDSDEIYLPTTLSVSSNHEYKILSEDGELFLLNQITAEKYKLTKNAEVHQERVNLFAIIEKENITAQAAVANAFDFPICAPNLTGCNYTAGTQYSQTHPGADYNGNGGGDTDRYWPVNAVANGHVVYTGYVGGGYTWGNIVMIEHVLPDGSKVWSQYAHLEDYSVLVNTDVSRGQQIGRIGKGHNNQFAAHLHFELRTQYFDAFAWQYGGSSWQNYYANPTTYINSHRLINNPTNCSNSPSSVRLFDATNCGGNASNSQNLAGWYDYGGTFNDRAKSIEIPTGWSVKLFTDNNEGSAYKCIQSTNSDLTNITFSDGTPVARSNPSAGQNPGETTSIRVYTTNTNCTVTLNQWTATFYEGTQRWNNTDDGSNQKCTATIPGMLDQNYGSGAPCNPIPMNVDNWVGDFQGRFNFSSSNNFFFVDHDDGFKLWIDGNLVENASGSGSKWFCQAQTISLSSGEHTIRALLREDTGSAAIKVNWSSDPSVCLATVNGSITLKGRGTPPSSRWSVPLYVQIFPDGNPTPIYETTLTTDPYGNFTIGKFDPGIYQIRIKNPQTVSRSQTITLSIGTNQIPTIYLPLGDINDDNTIDISDYSLLVRTFFKYTDPRADLDADSIIDLSDYSLMVSNFFALATNYETGLQNSALETVNLHLLPNITVAMAGQEFDVHIDAEAGSVPVLGIQAFLNFNPSLIQVVSITPGTLLTETILNRYNNGTGQIDFAAKQPIGATLPSGTFTVVTIRLKLVTATPNTTIVFNSIPPRKTKVVTNDDTGVSVLGIAENASVVVSAQNSAPSLNYFTTNTPTLAWGRITWATQYEIQVDDTSTFLQQLEYATIVDANTLAITIPNVNALVGGKHYWRVRAQNSSGQWSAWSAVDSFTINLP